MSQRPPSPSDRPGTVQEALDRAVLALRAQRLAEAEGLAAGVLRSNPGNVAAAQVLGQALLLQGRAKDAEGPLTRAARRSGDPAIETLLARALADLGRGDEALERLRQAAARRPAYPLAFLELGDELRKLGRFDEAQAVFEEGIALAPDAPGLLVGLGYVRLNRNDRAGARRLFLAARAAAPQRHDAQVALAGVMVQDGDYAAAAEVYRQALQARPDDATVRISLAKCLLEMGERAAGEANLRAAAHSAAQMAGPAMTALASTAHGRFFLRPSAAAKFLGAGA
ncbi:tetratricopeptide repeat protein [Phenylobacterium sp.]|uniref:tetratricopeptide repeat protein n=1 Tax=Phenylobacterium sp. TaxID=1871053 RepID=UPI0012188C7A|nr:tetratricopeptide repeat protein [Phenylobacterium sp.]THD58683.1 MAG: tetratricopeptide repeat protein [Phenylobacterium sp.]